MRARELFERARTLLQDEDSVRWRLPELCDWLNDGIREIARQFPAAFASMVDVPLVTGTAQTLPAPALCLLRPIKNATLPAGQTRDPRRTVTVIERELLDAVMPDWHAERRRQQQVKHVMLDEQDPRRFFVYPSNDGTGALTMLVCAPSYLTPSGDEDAMASYDAEIPVAESLAPALLDYVLARAWAKDAQFAGPAGRAAAAYSLFQNALAVAMGAQVNTSANRKAGVGTTAPGVVANA